MIETGLRILHWGDNRDAIGRIGHVDILMPIDESRHVMGYEMAESVIEKLKPHVVIPHHYYIFHVVQRQSTLMPADEWGRNNPDTSYWTRNEAMHRVIGCARPTLLESTWLLTLRRGRGDLEPK